MGHSATRRRRVVIICSRRHSVLGIRQTGGGFMKKLTLTLAATVLALGSMALSANAQQLSAGAHAQLQNATPIVKQVACRGFGARCGPGFVWTCGPYGRCWCRPC
jgi:hypothetical protein